MSKIILSFDVGIVNLAYCIIKKENNKFEILKWDLINIDDNKITCNHKIGKDEKLCGQNAKFSNIIDLNQEYYCTSHYKTFIKNFNKKHKNILEPIKIVDEKNKCNENKCKNISDYNIDGKYYCEKHYEKVKKEFLNINTPKKIKSQNSNYKSINNLSNHLFIKLDKLKTDFLQVDEVLIENQPSLLNPTMKTISALLFSYFTIRGIIDKEETKSKITSVNFISPQNKLKINNPVTEKTLNDKNLKKREEYILTKDLGKKYCKCLIQKEKKYTDILDSHKKNDDLCDSFLQGFYYLFFKDGNFPDEYKKMLDNISDECKKSEQDKEKKKIISKLKKNTKSIDIVL